MEELLADFEGLTIGCPDDIIAGKLMTKEKRHELFGKVGGGAESSKPEQYQRKMVCLGTGEACPKTQMRINTETFEFSEIIHPYTRPDGLSWTENFDGCQTYGNIKIYINFKNIVGDGGGQNRTILCVYNFIKGQLNFSRKNKDNLIYFANILDGDKAHNSMKYFMYIKDKYVDVQKKIYIGDLKQYFSWLTCVLAS